MTRSSLCAFSLHWPSPRWLPNTTLVRVAPFCEETFPYLDFSIVRDTVAPQVGKVIQSTSELYTHMRQRLTLFFLALLKLSEETDLDILNSCMETMVDRYQTELLPVAADLTARLVRLYPFASMSQA